MTPQQLAQATGASIPAATAWLAPLDLAMQRYQINTPLRQAAFLSQIGVESDGLADLVENLNYSMAALLGQWPDHFTAADAEKYGRTPNHPADQEMIANIAYANRMGNGDVESGDGWLFIGRGAIQLTGRANYRAAGAALNLPLEYMPEQVAQPQAASLTAAWYWAEHGCNAMADGGHITAITQAINGGTNGLARRQQLYAQGFAALNVG
ncbi:MAG: glycoside hydrolase family 19 protein [Betaproteobacteria bacterium]|nr:glycoside hydrolase family 19 protein [Betaproteobacteria bacterium]